MNKKFPLSPLAMLFCLLGIACTPQPDWELTGTIGKTVDGQIALFQEGDSVKGTFTNLATGDEIALRGEIDGGEILLKEFAGGEAVTGFFEGKWRSPIYSGNWISSDRSQRVPFAFYAEELVPNSGEERSKAGIQMAYDYWYQEQINSGNYCNWSTCYGAYEVFERTGEFPCLIGLPDSMDMLYGDLNDDGIIDGVSQVVTDNCDRANGRNPVQHMLAFLSTNSGNYLLSEELGDDHYDVWGRGGGIDTIIAGRIIGGGVGDHRFDPPPPWEVEYIYKNGHFVRIK